MGLEVGDRATRHDGDHAETRGEIDEELGGTGERRCGARVVDDRREGSVEVGHDRRRRRRVEQRSERATERVGWRRHVRAAAGPR